MVRDYDAPRPQLGIALCLLSMLIFASQDGVTKVLVKDLPVASSSWCAIGYSLRLLSAIAFIRDVCERHVEASILFSR